MNGCVLLWDAADEYATFNLYPLTLEIFGKKIQATLEVDEAQPSRMVDQTRFNYWPQSERGPG